MKLMIVPLLAVLTMGCVGKVIVKMPPPGGEQGAGVSSLAEVQVKDLRELGAAASAREALGVPMGNISFEPPETRLVKQFLEFELSKLLREKGVVEKRAYICYITEFRVNTASTALYWDVVGLVRLVLKQGEREYVLTGTNTQRTYVWPGETIIRQVVEESLKQAAVGLKPAVEN